MKVLNIDSLRTRGILHGQKEGMRNAMQNGRKEVTLNSIPFLEQHGLNLSGAL